jgi:hypothetical protein
MPTNYVINDGFTVNGKNPGDTITASEVENITVLVESGRVEKQGKTSGTLKSANDDPSGEE